MMPGRTRPFVPTPPIFVSLTSFDFKLNSICFASITSAKAPPAPARRPPDDSAGLHLRDEIETW